MMTKKEIAEFLGVDVQTMRNWKRTRPVLYRVIMQGLAVDEIMGEIREHYWRLESLIPESNLCKRNDELITQNDSLNMKPDTKSHIESFGKNNSSDDLEKRKDLSHKSSDKSSYIAPPPPP